MDTRTGAFIDIFHFFLCGSHSQRPPTYTQSNTYTYVDTLVFIQTVAPLKSLSLPTKHTHRQQGNNPKRNIASTDTRTHMRTYMCRNVAQGCTIA